MIEQEKQEAHGSKWSPDLMEPKKEVSLIQWIFTKFSYSPPVTHSVTPEIYKPGLTGFLIDLFQS